MDIIRLSLAIRSGTLPVDDGDSDHEEDIEEDVQGEETEAQNEFEFHDVDVNDLDS